MKKIFSYMIAGALAAGAVIAAPVAAQAAPSTINLPKGCESIYGKGELDFELTGAVRADVHPNKGKEYAYVVSCIRGDASTREYLVVTTGSGKVITKKRIGTNSMVLIESASAKSGVKYLSMQKYKGSTTEWRAKTAKWNKSAKTYKIKTGAKPKYLPSVHKLSGQMESGKKITAVTGSKSNLKKLNSYAKGYKKSLATSVSCLPVTSTKGTCIMVYLEGADMPALSFDITKKGSKYRVSNVEKASALDMIF